MAAAVTAELDAVPRDRGDRQLQGGTTNAVARQVLQASRANNATAAMSPKARGR